MSERKLNSLYIRLNNEKTIEIKQNKIRKTLYELQNAFNKKVVQKIRKMEGGK